MIVWKVAIGPLKEKRPNINRRYGDRRKRGLYRHCVLILQTASKSLFARLGYVAESGPQAARPSESALPF